MRYLGLIQASQNVILSVTKQDTLHHILKNYFRSNRKAGKRDRKIIQHLVYSYFRCRTFLPDTYDISEIFSVMISALPSGIEELDSYLLQQNTSQDLCESTADAKHVCQSMVVRAMTNSCNNYSRITEHISEQCNQEKYGLNLLQEQWVWIRINAAFASFVEKEFIQNGMMNDLQLKDNLSLAFSPKTALTQSISFQKGYFQIQDKQSQRVFESIMPLKPTGQWLDCCCGSGGKSILFKELFPATKLHATDIREKILINYIQRIKKSGTSIESVVLKDWTDSTANAMETEIWDGVLADVPCSGSGTWARSPEQISFFDADTLQHYSEKSFRIIQGVHPQIRNNGMLVFITCSVFSAENEVQVDRICRELNYTCRYQSYLEGYEENSDTLFVACLIKN